MYVKYHLVTFEIGANYNGIYSVDIKSTLFLEVNMVPKCNMDKIVKANKFFDFHDYFTF